MSAEGEPTVTRARQAREALLGQTVAGRYVLRALVGHGGMGAVYEAEHVGLGKRVAIKFVDPEHAADERVVSRFAREARAMSAIESPHIVSVFDAGSEGGRPYLVMELLRGEDLGERLRRERRVPVAEAMHIVAQLLKGLSRAHAAGIVHRDLKPDNVFLVAGQTDPLYAKIVDFGISKIERPRDRTSPLALTGRGTVLGTPFYMSPEQAQAQPDLDGRADLYSVGAILFECLTGRPPHTGETYEQVIMSICFRDAPDVRAIDPSIDARVATFVARALSRDRTHRFPSAERMLAALHDAAPAERARVPLDPAAAETLVSAGLSMEAAAAVVAELEARGSAGVATRIGYASETSLPALGTPAPARATPAPARATPARTTAESAHGRTLREGERPPRRSRTKIVATALIATLTGVGVMIGAVLAFSPRPAPPPAPTVTSAAPPPASQAPSVASIAAPPPPLPPPASAAAPPPSRTSRRVPKPSSSKLDLSRELP